MSFFKLSFRALLILACASSLAFAPTPNSKASLQGTVLDAKGGVVAGAKVTATNQGTGSSMRLSRPVWAIIAFPIRPAITTVTVEAPGFKKFISKGGRCKPNSTRVGCHLDVGAVSEQVTSLPPSKSSRRRIPIFRQRSARNNRATAAGGPRSL